MTNPNFDDSAILGLGAVFPEASYLLREVEHMYRFGRYDRAEVAEPFERLGDLAGHLSRAFRAGATEQCLRAAHDIWIAKDVLQITSKRATGDFGPGSTRDAIKALNSLANPRPKLVACMQRVLELQKELEHLYVEYAGDDISRQRQLAEEILALAEEFRQGVFPLCRGTERERLMSVDCMNAFVNIATAAHVMGQHTTPVQLLRRARASVHEAERACSSLLKELRERIARRAL
jgi:hypothetical protein